MTSNTFINILPRTPHDARSKPQSFVSGDLKSPEQTRTSGLKMDNSPLRKLSPELRNTIAEMALYHPSGLNIYGQNYCCDPLAFAHTCRELRQDYTQLFFSVNKFALCTEGTKLARSIKNLENCIGALNAQALGSIAVQLKHSYFECFKRIATVIDDILSLQENNHTLTVSELRLSIVFGLHSFVFREYLISPMAFHKSLCDAEASVRAELGSLQVQNNEEYYIKVLRLRGIASQLRAAGKELRDGGRRG